jgi:outer membrane immunogenic protein
MGGSSTSLPVIASAPYNWAGFYVGAVGAFGVNSSDTKDQDCDFSCSGVALDSWGVAGGLTAGYNFNVGTSGIVGIEADISASSFKDSWNSRDWASNHRTEMPWFATLRARAGLAYGGTLFYATGGLAFVNQKTRISDPGETFVNNFSGTEIGLAAGVGAEFALTGAWSVKAEYLAMFVPNDPKNEINATQQNSNLSVQSTTQLFRVGANYRFGGGSAAPGAAPMLANVNWTGFYLGAVAGGGTNSADGKDFNRWFASSGVALESWGASGGLTAGYNFQIGRSGLFGIEGDISAASFKESLSAPDWCCTLDGSTGTYHDTKMPWYATLRARAGLTYGSTLFYATGGLAFVNQKTQMFTRNPSSNSIPIVIDGTRTGLALGAGVEFALSQNWSVKGEYLALYAPGRTKQDPNILDDDTATYRVNSTTQLVRVGVNYRFGGAPAAPVMVRY